MHARCRCTICATFDTPKGKSRKSGERAAREVNRERVPADMTYKDWRAVYIERSKTFTTWRAETVPRGLAAGQRSINLSEGGKSPYLLGHIDIKDKIQVERALNWFESIIAGAPVENAMIITVTGEIYHCTGGLNTLETIVELGDKLKGAIVTHNHPVGSDNEYSFSDDDWFLFRDFKLARLRGIDEKFIYELNRNIQDKELVFPLEFANKFNFRHNQVAELAQTMGVGYRRWSR